MRKVIRMVYGIFSKRNQNKEMMQIEHKIRRQREQGKPVQHPREHDTKRKLIAYCIEILEPEIIPKRDQQYLTSYSVRLELVDGADFTDSQWVAEKCQEYLCEIDPEMAIVKKIVCTEQIVRY